MTRGAPRGKEVASARAAGRPRTTTSELAAWRARALQRLLTATAVVAAVAYAPAAWASVRDGVWSVLILDTFVWIVMVALALWRSAPYRLRATVYLGLWLTFSAALVVLIGPVGAGAVWLLAAPLLTTVLFGRRGAAWTIAAVAAFSLAYALMVDRIDVSRLGGVPGPGYDAATWSATAGSLLFLAVLIAGASGALLARMTGYAERLRVANDELAAALEDRARLENTLVATAKARALGSLAAGIAHDLNNLLVPISVAGAAARDAARDARQREHLDLVLGAADRAQGLARRVLAFSNEEAPERHPVPLGPLVHDTLSLVRASAPEGVAVAADVEPASGAVVADPGELQQVVMNLCTNAVRALAPTGGTLTVRLRRDGDAFDLAVADDGPGMDAATLARAFDPYFTTHRDGDGTGLGLAIVRHVVESLGGTVDLASERGRGTRATVRLPAVQGGPGPAAPPPAAPAGVP